jgi:hypothetical protein
MVVLGVAGCGGDDAKKVAADVGATSTSTKTGGDLDISAVLGDKDCQVLVAALANPFAAAFGGANQVGNDAAELFKEAAKNVPDEISADFKLYADVYDEAAPVFAAMVKAGYDPTKLDAETLAAYTKLGEKFSSPEYAQAAQSISTYLSANCTTSN